jgi:Tetracyclin repressor-like, C-terminal domain
MQYFGSKAELFAAVLAARWPVEAPPRGAARADQVGHVMDTFLSTVNDEGGAALAALIRSSLTNPEAAETTRRVLFDDSALKVLVPLLTGQDRELRAALVAAMLLGVHVGRTLLGVKALEGATVAQLRAHLEGPVRIMMQRRHAPKPRRRRSRRQ